MTIHAGTQLEWFDYDLPGWVHVYNKNIDLLNDALLKVLALQDILTDYKPDDGLLVWHAASSTWRIRKFN